MLVDLLLLELRLSEFGTGSEESDSNENEMFGTNGIISQTISDLFQNFSFVPKLVSFATTLLRE